MMTTNVRTSIFGVVLAIGSALVAWNPTGHPWVSVLGSILVSIGGGAGLLVAADASPRPSAGAPASVPTSPQATTLPPAAPPS